MISDCSDVIYHDCVFHPTWPVTDRRWCVSARDRWKIDEKRYILTTSVIHQNGYIECAAGAKDFKTIHQICHITPVERNDRDGYNPLMQHWDKTLRWRHNDHDGGSNHQPHGCLLNRLFRRKSKKTSKLRVTGLCVGNSPGPVNSPHKGPVTRKMFPFDDVIMMS